MFSHFSVLILNALILLSLVRISMKVFLLFCFRLFWFFLRSHPHCHPKSGFHADREIIFDHFFLDFSVLVEFIFQRFCCSCVHLFFRSLFYLNCSNLLFRKSYRRTINKVILVIESSDFTHVYSCVNFNHRSATHICVETVFTVGRSFFFCSFLLVYRCFL